MRTRRASRKDFFDKLDAMIYSARYRNPFSLATFNRALSSTSSLKMKRRQESSFERQYHWSRRTRRRRFGTTVLQPTRQGSGKTELFPFRHHSSIVMIHVPDAEVRSAIF
ncbi:hypothetical protein M378DRAFT_154662 [Amanita muscaria Koide BX008]|uniref:Uncharacterized protein n=1 Tax=Amanita muscaria (strain Koide BX008) TaxID=946122 RepID=A0A0C2XNL7_AMAMK|nr:hypothetical protein M378DRAFT_154662 [Amanita muscaria Koide BX008]